MLYKRLCRPIRIDARCRPMKRMRLPPIAVSIVPNTCSTRSNLLATLIFQLLIRRQELRRRHYDVVYLRTSSKHKESRIGADWELFIVGRKRTPRTRVQAKRVQRNDILKLRHIVAQSSKQQRDLLIHCALKNRMRPMYRIYSTESQRSLWRRSPDRIQEG